MLTADRPNRAICRASLAGFDPRRGRAEPETRGDRHRENQPSAHGRKRQATPIHRSALLTNQLACLAGVAQGLPDVMPVKRHSSSREEL